MKPELTNLLHRLGTQLEGFQSLVIFPSGRALAQHRHGCHPFASLDEVEQFAYFDPAAASCEAAPPPALSPAPCLHSPNRSTVKHKTNNNHKPHRQLGGLSINQFALLMCYEYIRNNDIRALNFLQNCWPKNDWLKTIAQLRDPDHPPTIALAE